MKKILVLLSVLTLTGCKTRCDKDDVFAGMRLRCNASRFDSTVASINTKMQILRQFRKRKSFDTVLYKQIWQAGMNDCDSAEKINKDLIECLHKQIDN